MKIRVEHEIKGRIRFSTNLGRLNPEQADCLLYYLLSLPGVKSAKVYERSGDGVIFYQGERRELLKRIAGFSPESEAVKKLVPECTSRRLNMEYRERLISRFVNRAVFNTLVPAPIRAVWTCIKAVRYVAAGLHCVLRRKLEVPVLDATAITVSLIRRDFKTASSVMFLLGVGELMEEWTHKKSVADLAGSMALNVDKVWLKREEGDVQIPIHQVQEGDLIRVAVGSMIPLDGIVTEGEAMVNQASLTGESIPVKKGPESSVYAGTVLEEGDLVIRVKQAAGSTRYEKIIRMLEESEKLKSSMESRAEHLADRLVPYSFLGTVAA